MNKVLLFGLLLLMSCSVNTANFNDHIDPKEREIIKTLDDKIIDALAQNNTAKLKEVFSEDLQKKSGPDLEQFVAMVQDLFKEKNYTILDEYLENSSAIGTTAVTTKGMSEEDYKIKFPVLTKETYISLLVNNGSHKSQLLTCIYGKFGSEWKLTVLRVGDYSFFGKTAIDFYKQAKINYEQGKLIDAANDIMMARKTARPADDNFHYQNEEKMSAFADKILQEANAKFLFPIKVGQIKTNPQILNFSPTPMTEGIFPTVAYLSQISLKDTVALKKENDELQKMIGILLPGIDKGKKYVFFRAYNEASGGKISNDSYGFILNTPGK